MIMHGLIKVDTSTNTNLSLDSFPSGHVCNHAIEEDHHPVNPRNEMKTISKKTRTAVYGKYYGRCAYCGENVEYSRFQVDHLIPKRDSYKYPDMDINTFDNLMPSCRHCNIHKIGFTLEGFRNLVGNLVTSLKKNAQFKRALRYNQIEICENPIVFYFEKQHEGRK